MGEKVTATDEASEGEGTLPAASPDGRLKRAGEALLADLGSKEAEAPAGGAKGGETTSGPIR